MDSKTSIIENSAAAILVANNDFGRCAIASELPRALWPIGQKTVLQRLVDHIAEQGIKKIVICSALNPVKLGKSVSIPKGVEIRFHQELFPRGTAGSVFDAWNIAGAELLFVFHAEIVSPPDIETMLSGHLQSRADMTIVFNPADDSDLYPAETAQIYICQRSVIEDIPHEGYCDIKESLVPKLIRNSKVIYAAQMPVAVGNFRNWKEYLKATASYIRLNDIKRIAETVEIQENVKMIGPVIIEQNVKLGANTLILGPVVISNDVDIDTDCVISESIIWQGSRIGRNCFIKKSVLKQNSNVGSSNTISETLLTRNTAARYSLTGRLDSARANLSSK